MQPKTNSLTAQLCFLCFLLIPVFVFAGARSENYLNAKRIATEVGGSVMDAQTGLPLAGATVFVKGSSVSTLTNESGNFTITISGNTAMLVISYVGYETQEVSVSAVSTNILVRLKPSGDQLSQVVVVGYGSQKKADVTGAVKSLTTENFNKGIVSSPEQLLQGKVSGVNVVSASGEPGGLLGITVRGPGGVRTGSTPLFVVDGLALDNSTTGGGNPLNFINPQDIESIDVLKDASATAIYGARGANGVIMITTKKGRAGRTSLSLNANYGIGTLVRPIDVFDAQRFLTEVKNLGATPIDGKANTNWQKEITRKAITQEYNVAMNGGAEKFNYYGSFGMQRQQGILKNNNLDRYTGRFNATQKLLDDRLTIEANLSASGTYNLRPSMAGIIGDALSNNPTYAAYDSVGNPAQYVDINNPMLTYKLEKDITKINRILGNLSPSLKILKNLVYKLNFGIDLSYGSRDIQSLPNAVPLRDGRLETINTYNKNTLIENYFTYTYNRGDHNITALAGHSYQKIYIQGRSYSINKFAISPVEPQYNPGLGQELTLVGNRPTGYALINELQSFFGRVNYSLMNKYLFTATVRADGSSKFGENNKYGIFPSFSAAWRVSEEDFMQNSIFSNLKLRAGWGQTGNQEIPSKITHAFYTSQVSATNSYPLYPNGAYPAGTVFSRLANPDIQWEVSNQIDLGIDFGILDNKLTGTIDYFNKKSNNILLQVIPADPVKPASTTWTNVKDMTITNQGIEVELDYKNTTASGLTYGIGGNVSFIKNVVKNSPYTVIPSGSASGAGLTSATVNGYVNDEPIGTFYLKEFTGFDAKGISTFRDVDGDGIISDKDRIAAGTALPKNIYSLHATLAYKGFDFVANFNGVAGNKIYDNTSNALFYKLRLSKSLNVTPEAIASAEESVSNSAPVSTRYLKDASFFRLNNASLGYTFNTNKMGIDNWVKSMRVSLTGQNLFLITKYNGFDPEVNTDRTIDGVLSYGIDYLSYPKSRNIILGLQINF